MQSSPTDAITVYWRPGCGFCSGLFRQLDRTGVAYERVNIWEDDAAAATVRAAARGNETVPTVAVGGLMLVNPDVHQLLAVAAEHAPSVLPEGYEPPQPGRLSRWLQG
jgi:mycoredoxin